MFECNILVFSPKSCFLSDLWLGCHFEYAQAVHYPEGGKSCLQHPHFPCQCHFPKVPMMGILIPPENHYSSSKTLLMKEMTDLLM